MLENPVFKNGNHLRVWLYLLLKANHKADKIMWNGGTLEVKEGQLVTGRKAISLDTSISESSIERALKYLEIEQQIEQQKTTKFRLITIIKWKEYQVKENSRTDNKRTTNGQQTDTNKNDKKVENDKKDPAQSAADDPAKFIFLFKPINPTLGRIYGRPHQREAAERLLKLHDLDWWARFMEGYVKKFPEKYCPKATTPIQLEEKLAKIYGYAEGERREEIKQANQVVI